MWPFKWFHLYLSAPPPSDLLLRVPLLEAIFPFIISLTELQEQWGYTTHYGLPAEVVTGLLKHDYVHVHKSFETSGGLKGTGLIFPEKRHQALVKQVTQVQRKLRHKELDIPEAVKIVQEAAEAEVKHLVDIIKRYAVYQVMQVLAQVVPRHMAVGAEAETAASHEQALRNRCLDQALECESFMTWFTTIDSPNASSNSETLCFYKTFFQTQLCIDLLNGEVMAALTSKAN
jgi:hypothetical protein